LTVENGSLILTGRLRPMKDEVVARNGVVTANHPQAAEAVMRILEQGGNAVVCTHFGGFGQGGVPLGTGVYLNGHMGQLIPKAGHPNSVEGLIHGGVEVFGSAKALGL
jgi:gamma-glutamyltranspeptidase